MTRSTRTFDTMLGRCAVSWSATGIMGVALPSPTMRDTSGSTSVDNVPAFVRDAIDGMTAAMSGDGGDLRLVPLDDRGIDSFRRSVYAATREIRPGATASYGEIARAIGLEQGARDVGAALARNPFPIIVPCHRIVAANGALTGFSAPGGLATKHRMLDLEGAAGFGQQVLFG